MTEQLTLNGGSVATCNGCGLARPDSKTETWTDIHVDRCRACRVAAGEELEECDSCERPTFDAELYSDSYYLSPFDDEATEGDARVCQDCWDESCGPGEGLFWCDGCNRQITESRGHHQHYRIIEATCEQLCLRCIEETLKAEGIAGFGTEQLAALFTEGKLFGMFFNVGELEAEGWTAAPGYSDRRIDGLDAGRALGAAAKGLHEAGHLIVIGYERLSIVGDEGFVTLFYRAPARCDRCNDLGLDGQPCGRCHGQGTFRVIDHERIARVASEREGGQ